MERLYLDNAATSYPKPESVLQAMDRYMRETGASAGRGAYQEARETGRLIGECREQLARMFNVKTPERIVFGLNASEALNLGIKGVVKHGDHVITTAMDHNSVLRPLNALKEAGVIDYSRVPCGPTGELDPDEVEQAIRPNTRLIAVVHGSNVTGTILPVARIGRIAQRHGIPYLIDAAQTAGGYPIDMEAIGADLLAFPGHKGLMGPLGTGVLVIREGIDLTPLKEGGTGSVSERDVQPEDLPDRYESGSHNAVGIVGLSEGVKFLLNKGVEWVRMHKEQLTAMFLRQVSAIEGITVYGPQDARRNAGVVSIRVDGQTPGETATLLDERYRIQVRAGLHCAPWAHRTIGTYPTGTVRFSLGFFTAEEDIERAGEALREIARGRYIHLS